MHLLGGGRSHVRLPAGPGRSSGEGALLRVPGGANDPTGVREMLGTDSACWVQIRRAEDRAKHSVVRYRSV